MIEFDPLTLEIIWQYSYAEAGCIPKMTSYKFYSPLISAAQRLPNGNTLITEGSGGRLLEVTRDCELVWEYISPYFGLDNMSNHVYRAYRVPYAWVPQLDAPEERAIQMPDNSRFRVPGSVWSEEQGVVEVEGALGYHPSQLCVVAFDDRDDEPK